VACLLCAGVPELLLLLAATVTTSAGLAQAAAALPASEPPLLLRADSAVPSPKLEALRDAALLMAV
jgi:hypothetical protein